MRGALALIVALVVSTGACSTARRASGPSLPGDALPVPLVAQSTNYSCGAAALESLLVYWQAADVHEQELYQPLHTTPQDGTEPEKIVEVARHYGLQASYRTGVTVDDLRQALHKRHTVILDLQAWQDRKRDYATDWDDGHYVVLVALDSQFLYLMDPSTQAGYAYLPLAELPPRWHDVESHDAGEVRLEHMAIFVSGQRALEHVPAPLQRME